MPMDVGVFTQEDLENLIEAIQMKLESEIFLECLNHEEDHLYNYHDKPSHYWLNLSIEKMLEIVGYYGHNHYVGVRERSIEVLALLYRMIERLERENE